MRILIVPDQFKGCLKGPEVAKSVGSGGRATNDGGFGMARALGFRFFDGEGMQVRSAINKLRTLKRIDMPRNLVLPPIIAAADVQDRLLGRHGATRVFGPQKGANG